MRIPGILGAVWGVGGVLLLVLVALYRLAPYAIELMDYQLSVLQIVILVVHVLFMAISEGYRGFQKQFSPRVAARALHLIENPKPIRIYLAPLFCMAYFDAPKRRMIASYSLTIMIIGFIILIRKLDQPWRGIIDAGVVVGLVWGAISLVHFSVKAFLGEKFDHSPEVI